LCGVSEVFVKAMNKLSTTQRPSTRVASVGVANG